MQLSRTSTAGARVFKASIGMILMIAGGVLFAGLLRSYQLAEETRKELQQATAMADTQASVVAAERQVQIQEFQASAAVKTAEGQAASRKLAAGPVANHRSEVMRTDVDQVAEHGIRAGALGRDRQARHRIAVGEHIIGV